jgi:phenol hydroxylase P0 protein
LNMKRVTPLTPKRSSPEQLGEASVRVTNPDHHGFVAFQFALGDPAIYLEMLLSPAAFEEFCATHSARRLTSAEGQAVDATEKKWRYGDDDEE